MYKQEIFVLGIPIESEVSFGILVIDKETLGTEKQVIQSNDDLPMEHNNNYYEWVAKHKDRYIPLDFKEKSSGRVEFNTFFIRNENCLLKIYNERQKKHAIITFLVPYDKECSTFHIALMYDITEVIRKGNVSEEVGDFINKKKSQKNKK
ncbi:hypothetical protein LCGC14_0495070 [marine sediment metagenome]|uniref:Uncharacterized protein n=1 Tax=marine sediment metagenome TaxID=412755 RepID=A0A0F9S5D2_9ZZZZ